MPFCALVPARIWGSTLFVGTSRSGDRGVIEHVKHGLDVEESPDSTGHGGG